MKRFLLILLPLLFIFSACKELYQEHYVILYVNYDEDTRFVRNSSPHIETKKDVTFYCTYELLPASDKNIDVTSVRSTNNEILDIVNIDYNNKKITVKAKNKGTAYITVYTNSYRSSTTLYIEVK